MSKATVGRLNVIISANAQQMVADLSRAQGQISAFASSLKSIAGGFVMASIAAPLVGFAKESVKLAMDLEKVSAGFVTIAKDGKLAAKTLEDLRKFADVSPFSTEEVIASARKLLGTGTAMQDLLPTMRVLGEISAGAGADIGLVAKALSDVTSKGHLAAQETNQFADQGINIIAELAKMYGKSRSEVLEMRAAHEITARDVRQALLNMTTGTGQFAGGMERLAQTSGGKLEELMSQFNRLKTEIGQALMPTVVMFMAAARRIIVAFNELSETVPKWLANIADKIGVATRELLRFAKIAAALSSLASSVGILGESFGAASESVAKFGEMSQADMESFLGPVVENAEKLDETIDDASKKFDKLRDKAAQITKELRNPSEIFADTMKELQELLDVGLITVETFDRGFEKAKDRLVKSLDTAKQLRDVSKGVGAAVRGTSAGFSAVQEGNRALETLKEQQKIEQQQLAVLKKAEAALEEIQKNTKTPPIEAKVVSM